jgi:hypothetical protein
MKYNIFKTDAEPRVSGIRDGLSQAVIDNKYWENRKELHNFIWGEDNLEYLSGNRPLFNLDLDDVELKSTAKLTDLISVSTILTGFIVSSKLRSLLEKFHLPNHTYFKVSFRQLNKKTQLIEIVNDYWWLFFQKETGENTVDFTNSEFDKSFHKKYLNKTNEELKIESYKDYMDIFLSCPPAPKSTKLKFNRNFDAELDLWGCRLLSVQDYISDRLLKAMEVEKITGYRAITPERAGQISKITRNPHCELIFE